MADNKNIPPTETISETETIKQKTKFSEANSFLFDKQHRDLIFYLSIAIFFLELIVAGVAFFYGVMHAEQAANGGPPRFNFPWIAYLIAAFVSPAALLLIVHLAGVGLFKSMRNQQDENAQRELPERLRKVYAVIQAAPTVVLLLGVMFVGVALFYIDGAMNAIFKIGASAEQYLPYVIGGIVLVWAIGYLARVWLDYRTRRLEAEYDFRREVMERTGIIIVEKGSIQLPPSMEASVTAIEGAEQNKSALPEADKADKNTQVVDVTIIASEK